ncbi:MAG: hypothetical protein DRJ98_07365 [Thermoprotei archaeon]|nr:MAG: hypothetical protein DRJ98_07365 [Thermoprotei archaeon]RLF17501.1 MAG: hypothetical protein DRN06_03725 [Thermoprotei archaeon]
MEEWRLVDLGLAEPLMAQTFYEAVAIAVDKGISPNTLILVQPSKPYVCIGYHQELEKEIDLDYCRRRGLPVIRRGQGGGAVYLDSNQLFYQVVASERSEVVPVKVDALFEKILRATVEAYRRLGVEAEFKPLNDVVVKNKKISGNGAGRQGSAIILVGNLILDVDYDSMAAVLKVPSEKFRDKMARSMREWITSLKKELGYVPPLDEVKKVFIEAFQQVLNVELKPGQPSDEEVKIWREEVEPRHLSHEWLYMPELHHPDLAGRRSVRIADGVKVAEAVHKAKKLIRVTAELIGDRLVDVMLSGDFFMIPSSVHRKIELALRGARLNRDELLNRVREVYQETRAETPGLLPEDIVEALMKLEAFIEKYPPGTHPYVE